MLNDIKKRKLYIHICFPAGFTETPFLKVLKCQFYPVYLQTNCIIYIEHYHFKIQTFFMQY